MLCYIFFHLLITEIRSLFLKLIRFIFECVIYEECSVEAECMAYLEFQNVMKYFQYAAGFAE